MSLYQETITQSHHKVNVSSASSRLTFQSFCRPWAVFPSAMEKLRVFAFLLSEANLFGEKKNYEKKLWENMEAITTCLLARGQGGGRQIPSKGT